MLPFPPMCLHDRYVPDRPLVVAVFPLLLGGFERCDVCRAAYELLQIPGIGKDGMANSMDPPHFSIWKNNAELQIVIGFFHDCPFDRAGPVKAILRVDAFEIFFPRRRSLSRIEAENPVPFLGEMQGVPIRQTPSPAAGVGQFLRLGQVRLPALRLLGQQFLLSNIDRGAEKPLGDFAFSNGSSDAAECSVARRRNEQFVFLHRSQSIRQAFS